MNVNPIIAILILKNIITEEEGQAVVDFVHDKPQSTILSDVINEIKEILPMSQEPLTGGPQQQQEELAARARVAEEQKAAAEAEEKANAEAAENADESDDKPADDTAKPEDTTEEKAEDSTPPKK